MSYEGYDQVICEDGHLSTVDCWDDDSACFICGGKRVWRNGVDDTNCDEMGIIHDFSSLVITPEELQTCNLGHPHVVKHAKYRVPTEKEAEKLRCYKDCNNRHLYDDD